MINFILYLVSKITTPIFNFIGFISIIFKPKDVRRKVYLDLAIGNDQYSNIATQFLLNKWLLKSDSVDLFGNPDETISSVIGKNKLNNKLTRFGLFWARFLNNLEPNHVENSIEQ